MPVLRCFQHSSLSSVIHDDALYHVTAFALALDWSYFIGLKYSSPDSRHFSVVSDLSWTRWSSVSPNVLVGLDRVQKFMLFFIFQNKTINLSRLFRKRVIAIGLTPSRSGVVIGRLLNAQLCHMSVRLALSVRAAWRHK